MIFLPTKSVVLILCVRSFLVERLPNEKFKKEYKIITDRISFRIPNGNLLMFKVAYPPNSFESWLTAGHFYLEISQPLKVQSTDFPNLKSLANWFVQQTAAIHKYS